MPPRVDTINKLGEEELRFLREFRTAVKEQLHQNIDYLLEQLKQSLNQLKTIPHKIIMVDERIVGIGFYRVLNKQGQVDYLYISPGYANYGILNPIIQSIMKDMSKNLGAETIYFKEQFSGLKLLQVMKKNGFLSIDNHLMSINPQMIKERPIMPDEEFQIDNWKNTYYMTIVTLLKLAYEYRVRAGIFPHLDHLGIILKKQMEDKLINENNAIVLLHKRHVRGFIHAIIDENNIAKIQHCLTQDEVWDEKVNRTFILEFIKKMSDQGIERLTVAARKNDKFFGIYSRLGFHLESVVKEYFRKSQK